MSLTEEGTPVTDFTKSPYHPKGRHQNRFRPFLGWQTIYTLPALCLFPGSRVGQNDWCATRQVSKKGEGWIPSVQTAAKTPDYHILMATIGCRRKVVLSCSGQISNKQQRLGGASRLSLHERKVFV